jgi:hypothetical protein
LGGDISRTPSFFMFLSASSLFSLTELKKKTFSEVNFHAYDTTTIVVHSLWKGNSHRLIEDSEEESLNGYTAEVTLCPPWEEEEDE